MLIGMMANMKKVIMLGQLLQLTYMAKTKTLTWTSQNQKGVNFMNIYYFGRFSYGT